MTKTVIRWSAAEIARMLDGGCWRGDGNHKCRCPVPTHGQGRGDRNHSLSVRDGDDGRLLVRCHAGCDPRDVLAELRRRFGDATTRRVIVSARHNRSHQSSLSNYAQELWARATPIEDTLGEAYLRQQRGISIKLPPTLRFLKYGPRHHRTGAELPCMIAALSDESRQVVSVQATRLIPSTGAKIDDGLARQTYGGMGKACVRLAAASDELGLAEGIETALSATQLFNVSTWAMLGAERFMKVELPECVRSIVLFADADPTGHAKTEEAARHYRRLGLQVRVLAPDSIGQDWNDVLRARGT